MRKELGNSQSAKKSISAPPSTMAAGTRKSSSSGSHLDPSEEESHTDDAKNLGPPSSSPQSRVSPPALLHRIKYAESILALAVAKQHVYAGTQSGEILVCIISLWTGVLVTDCSPRNGFLRITLSQGKLQPIRAAYYACVYLRTKSCYVPVRQEA
jgi:hypothetical protein